MRAASVARRILARLGLAVVGLLMGALIGEIGLRAMGLPKSGPFLQEFRGERFKLMSYDSNPSGALDLDLSVPEVRARVAGRLFDPAGFEASWAQTPHAVEFELNAQGFRERDFESPSAGTKRIVVIGDSFSVGHGLPNALSYPRQLEALLRSRAGGAGRNSARGGDAPAEFEVLNLGRGDTDLRQILRTAGFALQRLDPDVLVYGYFLNDPLRSVPPERGAVLHDMLDAGWVEMEQTRTTTRIGQSELGSSRVLDLIRRFGADRDVTRATVDWYQRLHEPEAWRPTLERITELSRAAQARGVRFVLVLLPLPFEISGDHPFDAAHRQMRESCERMGIEVIDVLPALRGFPDEALRLHPRDRHPSPTYTRVVSELLASAFSDLAGVATGEERRASYSAGEARRSDK